MAKHRIEESQLVSISFVLFLVISLRGLIVSSLAELSPVCSKMSIAFETSREENFTARVGWTAEVRGSLGRRLPRPVASP